MFTERVALEKMTETVFRGRYAQQIKDLFLKMVWWLTIHSLISHCIVSTYNVKHSLHNT